MPKLNVSLRQIPLLSRLDRVEIALLAGLVAIAGLIWAFVQLADEVTEGDTTDFDHWLIGLLRTPGNPTDPLGPPWLEEAVRDITALGSYSVLGLLTGIVVIYMLLVRKHGMAVLTLISILGGALFSTLLKMYFDRPRPDLESSAQVFTASFPSGHATLSAVTYLTLGALLARVEARHEARIFWIGTALALTVLVGASRLFLGVHFPTDILAGWTLGASWAGLCLIVARWLQRRGTVEEPHETSATKHK